MAKRRVMYRFDSVRVSDHALLRFLQRAGGLDAEAMRAAISASLVRAKLKAGQIGCADFDVLADGLRYVVRNEVLVTVLSKDMPNSGAKATIEGE